MTEAEFRTRIALAGLDKWADKLVASSQPCISLTSVRNKAHPPAVGGSKLGGEPDLAIDTEWPERNGRPLSFLGQINLDGLPTLATESGLPRAGLLSFFYDCEEQPWGFDPEDKSGSKILYQPEIKDLQRRSTPDDLEDEGWFLECRLDAELSYSLPSSIQELDDLDDDATNEAFWELLGELGPDDGSARHQLLGFPLLIQNPMELECQLASNGLYCGDASGYNDSRAKALEEGAKDWQLLFQIDSDDKADMMWGDVGTLYFWIRSSDLKSHDFDASWLILQCS